MSYKIAAIGLGYVGLPVALAVSKKFTGTVGFDTNPRRTAALRDGIDDNGDVDAESLKGSSMTFTSDEGDLKGANFFIVAVPTPIDRDKRPDLSPLIEASKLVGRVIREGGIAVFESTVYPGVTEEVCGPIIADVSGLEQGRDFKLAYSPERINPGDKDHTLERIVKVVSAEDEGTLDSVCGVYGSIIDAGVHRAPSIRVAEAAKVIENTQRDLNIALMNELALIFDRMGISTRDVLDAACTKWNFLPFSPGLVGGHCIGVDPYYLTSKAEQLGYIPQVITAGRRINDSMGQFIAQRAVRFLANRHTAIKDSRVGVLGVTFKEDIKDIRNSRVPSMIAELKLFGANVLLYDPEADAEALKDDAGLDVCRWEELRDLDAVILAVAHKKILSKGAAAIESMLKPGGVLLDVKSAVSRHELGPNTTYWAL